MSEIAFSLSALLGPELAVAFFTAWFVAAFGFVVYGGTCFILWAGMAAYDATQRMKHPHLRHEPGKPAAGGADRV
jgi:hypothetical protein